MTMSQTVTQTATECVLPSVAMQYPTQSPVGTVVMDLHPLSNYTFGTKDAMYDKDSSVTERFKRLKSEYAQTGTRRSVEG
jgi:cleavage and polyadenylation specificity factor subunit 5